MFEGFAHVWTPVMLARRLKQKPMPMKVAGEKLVFFRGAGGEPGAVLDACPHRGVALSLGKVKDGCLECPFHGWRFNVAGENTHVPFNPDARRERLSAVSVPVRLVGELLWIYTAPGRTAPSEPVVPDGLVDPGCTRTYLERTWKCHWTRAMENMLDSPHLPFVHKTTIGRPMVRRMRPDSRMVVTWEVTPFGGRQRSQLDDFDNLAHVDFYRPNMMALHIPIPGKHFRMHALVVPVDANTTRLLVIGSRDFARPRWLNPFFNTSNGIIADQDRAVVESSDPPEVPEPARELSVASDRATLAFRKYYFDELKHSSAPRPGRSELVALAPEALA